MSWPNQTLTVLNEVGTSGSAQQLLMRTALCDQMRGLEKQKVQGVTDLVLVGYDGDPDDRVLRSSVALGQAIERGETRLEDLDEAYTAELEDTYVPVQEYLASAALDEPIVEGSSGG